jgi:glycerol-3-phosphate acyltransferase PlsY
MQTLGLIIIFGYLIGAALFGLWFAPKAGNDRRLFYEN